MKRFLLTLALVVATALQFTKASAADAPTPTLEQRVAGLEAYIGNSDPTAALKDKDGKIPEGLTTVAASNPGPGHNAWMMTSAALVLFMTLPGLFLFYGGLVRRKNILSVIAQCFGIAGLVTILWVIFGHSLIFADGSGPFIGNLKFAMLKGVDSLPNTNYAYWVSHNVFSMYQLMFAIITPALILGAVAERMKFSAILLFVGIWMVVVYFPLAHMVWGVNGLMNGVWNAEAKIKAIDFAGGTVVHMSSGWSALVLCLILGKRLGFPREPMPPHSMVLCAIGTGMLWVGWYGFNAGSAVAADGVAANAFMTTTIATAVASFVWPLVEWIVRGKPSVLGFCSGAVAGLVVVTPACGFITAGGALVIGVAAGLGSVLLLQGQGHVRLRRCIGYVRCSRRRRDSGSLPDGNFGHSQRQRKLEHQPQGHCGQDSLDRANQGHQRHARARHRWHGHHCLPGQGGGWPASE